VARQGVGSNHRVVCVTANQSAEQAARRQAIEDTEGGAGSGEPRSPFKRYVGRWGGGRTRRTSTPRRDNKPLPVVIRSTARTKHKPAPVAAYAMAHIRRFKRQRSLQPFSPPARVKTQPNGKPCRSAFTPLLEQKTRREAAKVKKTARLLVENARRRLGRKRSVRCYAQGVQTPELSEEPYRRPCPTGRRRYQIVERKVQQ